MNWHRGTARVAARGLVITALSLVAALGIVAGLARAGAAQQQKGAKTASSAKVTQSWDVKIKGKAIEKLPFAEKDFAEYGKRVTYKDLYGDARDRALEVYGASGKETATAALQVFPDWHVAQKLLSMHVTIETRKGPGAVAKAGGKLDFGDACFYRWSGKPEDVSSEDVTLVSKLVFVRNNVLVVIFRQGATGAANAVDLGKLARFIDDKLAGALVVEKKASGGEGKGKADKVEST